VRRYDDEQALVIVPRLVATLTPDSDRPPLGEDIWTDTRIVLEKGARPHYRNVFTDTCVSVYREGDRAFLRSAEVFDHFPVAMLV
jgi:maltooligosyltrehalose synthase